jgi:hypothetical protein
MRVSWDNAQSDLESLDPTVVGQLKRNAEQILHNIPPIEHRADEGAEGGIMWHRGHPHERLADQPGGPQEYFLFYVRSSSNPEFEILAVRSIYQVASMCVQMESSDFTDSPLL